MSLSPAKRERRRRDIGARATAPSLEAPRRCTVLGCTNLTQRSAGTGLSTRHCKRHKEMLRRHGVTWRKSFTETELAPYRKSVRTWVRLNRGRPEFQEAITDLDSMLAASGKPKDAFAVQSARPKEKARIALARLREAGKGGEHLLTIVLTIKAITTDKGPRGNPEFQQVQIAKRAHRLIPRTRIKSDIWGDIAKRTRPEGLVMRILGEKLIEAAGGTATGEVIREVIALKNAGGAQ
ncbi:MAG: hypothetical protein KKB66_13150 [Alphaproteobacteria bacterium]|nr:hypothetical protein [Alphaproteobacteria bacterium]MBU0805353.1 hypothetical protein [Alphaproteobacteria bacterium]MBU0873299.1 hypothetical protein [Alphaproteobacteria bacterium]MBU1401473.1 hypothetical protein [Alphaproteobacteria bacterium]MBU1592110.1 hypothetical protein [Alphaproteobacteria bacterium]